jgi:hypothetical protein
VLLPQTHCQLLPSAAAAAFHEWWLPLLPAFLQCFEEGKKIMLYYIGQVCAVLMHSKASCPDACSKHGGVCLPLT